MAVDLVALEEEDAEVDKTVLVDTVLLVVVLDRLKVVPVVLDTLKVVFVVLDTLNVVKVVLDKLKVVLDVSVVVLWVDVRVLVSVSVLVVRVAVRPTPPPHQQHASPGTWSKALVFSYSSQKNAAKLQSSSGFPSMYHFAAPSGFISEQYDEVVVAEVNVLAVVVEYPFMPPPQPQHAVLAVLP